MSNEIPQVQTVSKDTIKELTTQTNVPYYIKFTFIITYIFLLTTATITFIEAMRTNNPTVRHILNLETAVSLIASYFYSLFVDKISAHDTAKTPIDWSAITTARYIDWSMTTPIMLLVLALTLSDNIKKNVTLSFLILIIILNYVMLFIGYLGETNAMDKWTACMGAFVPFIIMFSLIFYMYVKPVFKLSNYIIFGIFVSIWSLYGVFYMFNDENKNIGTNVLDCLAKCCFGLGLWAYFSKIVVLG
jgi:hypothetical protein